MIRNKILETYLPALPSDSYLLSTYLEQTPLAQGVPANEKGVVSARAELGAKGHRRLSPWPPRSLASVHMFMKPPREVPSDRGSSPILPATVWAPTGHHSPYVNVLSQPESNSSKDFLNCFLQINIYPFEGAVL